MASSKNYTSKGDRKSVSNGKQKPSDVSSLEIARNKMKAFKKGRKVWLTISNPNTKETNKKFIKVNASEFVCVCVANDSGVTCALFTYVSLPIA